ncbi:hypothetical protein C8F04DRAFT_1199407 [Mycena alexandri]|uniref:Uncharacterized protein n=1 Tax=Mycena alexandri TaxID=1745969 RepID=A0AAD6RZA3_9AGAR|nr:hypothetical protein C8F04DRAFT_1199407 [Mycena alexandri]
MSAVAKLKLEHSPSSTLPNTFFGRQIRYLVAEASFTHELTLECLADGLEETFAVQIEVLYGGLFEETPWTGRQPGPGRHCRWFEQSTTRHGIQRTPYDTELAAVITHPRWTLVSNLTPGIAPFCVDSASGAFIPASMGSSMTPRNTPSPLLSPSASILPRAPSSRPPWGVLGRHPTPLVVASHFRVETHYGTSSQSIGTAASGVSAALRCSFGTPCSFREAHTIPWRLFGDNVGSVRHYEFRSIFSCSSSPTTLRVIDGCRPNAVIELTAINDDYTSVATDLVGDVLASTALVMRTHCGLGATGPACGLRCGCRPRDVERVWVAGSVQV